MGQQTVAPAQHSPHLSLLWFSLGTLALATLAPLSEGFLLLTGGPNCSWISCCPVWISTWQLNAFPAQSKYLILVLVNSSWFTFVAVSKSFHRKQNNNKCIARLSCWYMYNFTHASSSFSTLNGVCTSLQLTRVEYCLDLCVVHLKLLKYLFCWIT